MMDKTRVYKYNRYQSSRNFKFYLGTGERYIHISSDFDSGNINCVRQISYFQYRLYSVCDGSKTNCPVNSKSWFYFYVHGFPKNTRGRFIVTRLQALISIYYSKYSKFYRPVYRVNNGPWHRMPSEVPLLMNDNGNLECIIEHTFRDEFEKAYFAFCYPYSYSRHVYYLNNLNDFYFHDEFYFHKEILINSPENRPIHLITITSYDHRDTTKPEEEVFDPLLFPERCRPNRYNKPVILITARVHPGETPASFAMEGVIDFLLNTNDLRAHLLRKMFVVMLVPMINVDGVYLGHFRMDNFGKNLNRYYLNPDPERQPAIYGIKQLSNHLIKDNRLSFYFDLHAHNAKKGSFIYGNAINDFVYQVESQVFCKLFSMNHAGFEYYYCNFSYKHMNAKDRNEELTKEGCGRVVMYRAARIIHSYSIECGIISANHVNTLPYPTNSNFIAYGKYLYSDALYKQDDKTEETKMFDYACYHNLGKNLLVTILDVFDKNPYNRVYNSKYKTMEILRRITAFEIFHQTERFRMFYRFVYGKVKNINNLIQGVLNTKLHYRKLYNFYFYDDEQLKAVHWPNNIPGLSKPEKYPFIKLKKFKSMTEQRITTDDQLVKTMSTVKYLQSTITVKYSHHNSEHNGISIYMPDTDRSSETENGDCEVRELVLMVNQYYSKYILKQFMKNELSEYDRKRISMKLKNNSLNYPSPSRHDYSLENGIMAKRGIDTTIQRYKEREVTARRSIGKKSIHHLLPSPTGDECFQIFGQCIEPVFQSENNKDRYEKNRDKYSRAIDHETKTAKDKYRYLRNNSKLSTAEYIRQNIYDTIKQYIMQGIRKDQMKKLRGQQLKFIDKPFQSEHQIRSTRQRDSRRLKSKVKLPALGSNMYIITTSAKAIVRE